MASSGRRVTLKVSLSMIVLAVGPEPSHSWATTSNVPSTRSPSGRARCAPHRLVSSRPRSRGGCNSQHGLVLARLDRGPSGLARELFARPRPPVRQAELDVGRASLLTSFSKPFRPAIFARFWQGFFEPPTSPRKHALLGLSSTPSSRRLFPCRYHRRLHPPPAGGFRPEGRLASHLLPEATRAGFTPLM